MTIRRAFAFAVRRNAASGVRASAQRRRPACLDPNRNR
jgi:hypothetical protein